MKMLNLGQLLFLFLIMILLSSRLCMAKTDERLLQGYNWYSESMETQKKQQPLEENSTKLENKTKEIELPEYERNIRKLQKQHEEAHRRALDKPTLENIIKELYYEKIMTDKASLYAARRVTAANILPQLIDMKSHSNVLHQRISDEQQKHEDQQKLFTLSKGWGLILQVQDDCPYCHIFAPIVKEFAADNGFQLLAASSRGKKFEDIEGVVDRGQMQLFNPKGLTPMLYLLKNDGSEVLPISRGINNKVQIVENIKNINKHVRRLF